MLGNRISRGDKIIYSAADGRSAVLRRGVVVGIYVKEQDSYYTGPIKDTIKLTVEAERLGWRRDGSKPWQKLDRVVHLAYLERVVVVDSNAW